MLPVKQLVTSSRRMENVGAGQWQAALVTMAPIPRNPDMGVWEPQNQVSGRGATSQWLLSRAGAPTKQPGQSASPEETRESMKSSVYTISTPTSVFLLLHTTLCRWFLTVIPQKLPVSDPESLARPGSKDREPQGTRDRRTHTWAKIFLSRRGSGNSPSPGKVFCRTSRPDFRLPWAPLALYTPHPIPPPPLSSPTGSVQAAPSL